LRRSGESQFKDILGKMLRVLFEKTSWTLVAHTCNPSNGSPSPGKEQSNLSADLEKQKALETCFKWQCACITVARSLIRMLVPPKKEKRNNKTN
jgi:hypothetical protein